MHVSKTLAVIIGLITCWPIVYFVSFIAFMFSTVMWKQTEPFEASFDVFFVAHLLTMVVIIGLLAFYIAHLFRNESMPGDRRVLWAIVLFMGNVFACPVYWYLYIWTRPPNSRLGAT